MNTINLPYRENVCLLIINDRQQIFLGERAGHPAIWQFPQGGVEPGFSLEENAIREAHEELGADIALFRIVCRLEHTHKYDFARVPEYAVGRYRGQSQTFWILKFLGKDTEINLEKSDHELQNWIWADPEQVRQMAEPVRLEGYQKALLEFEDILARGLCA